MTDLTGAQWFKSSRSGGNRDCVEAAHLAHGRVGVRDSKNPTRPALVFTPIEWDTFLKAAKTGTFG
ncbi:DUF397 domain-containing protein [Nocardia zapadnayensis]|uniref:DUF397 domain-containing protein n=1 Tax=Nocardia rhamnosiphila TaxID=426716 RepID=UPI0022470508|nr:DUF397 domain-containing protein [Nocardia zapadnayensis]MCX0275586.1 DUF397 domain-containing protein [Nocardia zapadnayensis]